MRGFALLDQASIAKAQVNDSQGLEIPSIEDTLTIHYHWDSIWREYFSKVYASLLLPPLAGNLKLSSNTKLWIRRINSTLFIDVV